MKTQSWTEDQAGTERGDYRRYSVAKLIAKHGRNGNMSKWREQLNGDCPKRDARMQDRCDLVCPDLPKVV